MPYFFIGLRGGGGGEKHCTRASLHSDTVEDLIRIRGQVWKILIFWPKIKKDKLQELAIQGACDCNGG